MFCKIIFFLIGSVSLFSIILITSLYGSLNTTISMHAYINQVIKENNALNKL